MEATMYFKRGRGQNYMMRSEKRPGYPNAPRRQKPPGRSFWYQLITILLLILCCPVGLILLWRKRLTWPNPVKLTATLLSIILLFLMIGGALWYPFKNERLRRAQQSVSTAIYQMGEAVQDIPENWSAFWENGMKIGAVAGDQALNRLLNVIATPTPQPTQAPHMALTPGKGSQQTVSELLNQPTPTPTMQPTPTPDASANTLERPTPTSDPLSTPAASPVSGDSPTPVPPVTAAPSATATPTPTPLITATPTPTVDPKTIPELIPMSEELTVWYTSNGKWYHAASVCGSMTGAREHSLASAVQKKKTACPYCNPVDAKWADEELPGVYVCADSYWHINPDCESCTNSWTPMVLYEAISDRSLTPCDACGALYYVNGVPEQTGADVPAQTTASAQTTPTVRPAQATQSLAPGQTPRPTPLDGGSQLTNVTNGDEVVYYSGNSSYYHRRSMCSSAATSAFLPGKLMDALLEDKLPCPVCNPPQPLS